MIRLLLRKSIFIVLFWQRSRITELTDFGLTLQVNEDVLRFEIAVHNVGGLQEMKATQNIVCKAEKVSLCKLV